MSQSRGVRPAHSAAWAVAAKLNDGISAKRRRRCWPSVARFSASISASVALHAVSAPLRPANSRAATACSKRVLTGP